MTDTKMPQHVADQRAAVASGKRNKLLRRHKEISEHYDVFQRINMHNGDKNVCWEWNGAHGLGTRGEYRPRVCIDQKHYYVYRVVYQLYTGYKLQENDVVRHSCDNSWCCNPYHMMIGTQADNVADMMKRERVGMKHYQVKRIMEMLEIGCSAAYIANTMRSGYHVSLDASVIRRIRMRKIYKHIEWEWGDKWADARKRRLATLRELKLAGANERAIIGTSYKQGEKDGEEKD